MQFGLQLNSQHLMAENMRERLEEFLDQVHLAQAVGFRSIVAPQHYLPAPFQMLQPLPLLARMAPEADKMRLIAGILLLSLHNPVAPHPLIWMGADGDGAVGRATRLVDTWYINPHAKLETLERQMTLYRHALAEQGKPFPQELPIRRELFAARDRDLALRTCMPYPAAEISDICRLGTIGSVTAGRQPRLAVRRAARSAVHHRVPQ